MSPWYMNLLENPVTVQFQHRWLAIATTMAVAVFWFRAVRSNVSRNARIVMHLFLGIALLQVALGIMTLLYVVPVPLAVVHQAGAMALFTAALTATHVLKTQ